MGREYGPAIDMYVDESRVFIGSVANSSANKDLSIVLHGTGSPGNAVPTAQEIALFFASNKDEVSSHFVIGRDGTVVQCVSLKDGAGSNCCVEAGYDGYWNSYLKKYSNLNLCTISIEHCNNIDNSLSPTREQLQSSEQLVQFLCKKFQIPTDRIKTHASIDPKTRARCPGNYPIQELIQSMGSKQATISETQVETEITDLEKALQQAETELQALRGMVTVKGPTVIE